MLMVVLALLAAASGTAAAAARPAAAAARPAAAAARPAAAAAGTAAAAPRPAAATCLITGRQLDHRVIDEATLLVRAGGRWHRSLLPDGCPGLKPGRLLVRREASPRLCANDLFEVRDNFTHEVFSPCRFGPFEALPKGTRP